MTEITDNNIRNLVKLYCDNKKTELPEDLREKPIGEWDVSRVTNMWNLFNGQTKFNDDINDWNVSAVNNMSHMFYEATAFNQRLNKWNVSNVKDMSAMFFQAKSFNQPLNEWDVSNVTNMEAMFYDAVSFNQPIEFNQPLNKWNVSNVKNMGYMFNQAKAFNQPLNNWNVSEVKLMAGMFEGAIAFNQPLNNWNVSAVKNMNRMFFNAKAFNQPLNNWTINNDCVMEKMFIGATSFDITNSPVKMSYELKLEKNPITIKRSVVQTGMPEPWWENAWSDIVTYDPFKSGENIVIFNGQESEKDKPSITNYIMKEESYKNFKATQRETLVPTTKEDIRAVKLYKLVIEEDKGAKPEGVELSGGRRNTVRRKRRVSKRRKSVGRKKTPILLNKNKKIKYKR